MGYVSINFGIVENVASESSADMLGIDSYILLGLTVRGLFV